MTSSTHQFAHAISGLYESTVSGLYESTVNVSVRSTVDPSFPPTDNNGCRRKLDQRKHNVAIL